MSDDWDTYFCEVDDKPASMLLDIGIGLDAPFPLLPHMGYVSLQLRRPDGNGLSADDEFDALNAVEDALAPALADGTSGLFVGRCTTDGYRDFFFYVHGPVGWEERVAAVMRKFADYTWTADIQHDPDWDTYFEFLYPDSAAMQAISNDRVRRLLEENGDNLNLRREVGHWVYFDSEENRADFCRQIAAEGFQVEAPPKDPDSALLGVYLTREDIPAELDALTMQLVELAGACGGEYDGWEAAVAEESEEKPN